MFGKRDPRDLQFCTIDNESRLTRAPPFRYAPPPPKANQKEIIPGHFLCNWQKGWEIQIYRDPHIKRRLDCCRRPPAAAVLLMTHFRSAHLLHLLPRGLPPAHSVHVNAFRSRRERQRERAFSQNAAKAQRREEKGREGKRRGVGEMRRTDTLYVCPRGPRARELPPSVRHSGKH